MIFSSFAFVNYTETRIVPYFFYNVRLQQNRQDKWGDRGSISLW